ncbi:MAG TPA: pitrilysin family protein [Clostridiaceae bacterium]
MKEEILDNGIKLIYKEIKGNISSFSIAFDAGANQETKEEIGLAHLVEHVLFKGTTSKSELEINVLCDKYFGFNNAMTNFPYAMYYGTTLNEDFEKAVELYGDILINPLLKEEGFKEEVNIILEELKEWIDDSDLYLEDVLFKNSFSNRRIKERIIGTEAYLKNFKIEDVRRFYEEYYTSKNCCIAVVSSIPYETVKAVVGNCLRGMALEDEKESEVLYNINKPHIYKEENSKLKIGRIEYIFPIDALSYEELAILHIFNTSFGEGVSSLLFDRVRTKKGLAYEIYSQIKVEKGIKLFIIRANTSKENIDKVISIIDECIEASKLGLFSSQEIIEGAIKKYQIRMEIKQEKSIEMAKFLATNHIMFKESIPDFYNISQRIITTVDIERVISKLFNNPIIQILSNN